jgi:hypothetical protein
MAETFHAGNMVLLYRLRVRVSSDHLIIGYLTICHEDMNNLKDPFSQLIEGELA